MMTRKIAIERLRTVGTLRADGVAANTVSLADATAPLSRAISQVIHHQRRQSTSAQRVLAPACAQMVLP
ncbi:hypothetical protein [Janthinobacterium sp. NKUCC08_JDC]|uniref:hypothetical protein n=1 Tax=Janthinobacterium sp. NKUCC08_JDC TaxID=2842122 RepID=UPI001C5B316E|nr:hypothetical protein [Janthinobacterium sp. NKUCC08_JDC]MBW3496955.1 hypothetical protein [Janthinobacterium sp. NKUCC08_JDC]